MSGPWDAVIVGGGPAGAVTALLLAREGRRVVIVERAEFPRPKPCGDCLSAAATGLLRDLGLLARVLALEPARLDGWRIVSPGGHAGTGRFPGRAGAGLALERDRLDAALLDAATGAGATLVRGRARDVIRSPSGRAIGIRLGANGDSSEIRARVMIGADGLRSVVSRRLDLVRRAPRLRKLSLTTHGTDGPGALEMGEMHVLDGGCIGIAPTGGGRFNLTLVVGEDHAAALRRMGPEAFLERWIERAPTVAGRVDSRCLVRPFLASGPFDWPTHRVVAPGAALVGDAAGYYDPFTGQGIYRALAGGRLLAESLAPVLAAPPSSTGEGDDAVDTALGEYAAAHRRLTAPSRRFQRVVEALLSRPPLADATLRRLGRARAAMDRVIEVTGDLRGPGSLLSPPVVSSFLFPSRPSENA